MLSTTANLTTRGGRFFRHVESCTNSRGTAGANKHCQGARVHRTQAVCHPQCMGFSALLLSQPHICTNLYFQRCIFMLIRLVQDPL